MIDLFGIRGTPASGKRLLLSMSGGKTSAYMTRRVLLECAYLWDEIVTVFANTGQESELTLEFIRNCDLIFNFKTVWVEAVVNPEKGIGTSHKIVTYESASRNGEPFEDVIRKYGIPNMKHPHCTRELKQRAIESYAASLGWGSDYSTAIGIRADEVRRVSPSATKRNLVYPLIDWFYTDKQDVNSWWEEQPFNLQLKEHQGNCKWCWKKSFSKHAMLLKEDPSAYDFPARMESEYGYVGPDQEPDEAFPRVFFRGNRSVVSLKQMCGQLTPPPMVGEDADGGCAESCELYPTLPLFEEALL
jgi:3'-phosphoadenosine 5'-phosphosulfate sulfotransferase (PAPS reductase)/FAD synthetase